MLLLLQCYASSATKSIPSSAEASRRAWSGSTALMVAIPRSRAVSMILLIVCRLRLPLAPKAPKPTAYHYRPSWPRRNAPTAAL